MEADDLLDVFYFERELDQEWLGFILSFTGFGA